jgi:hypothetical protein
MRVGGEARGSPNSALCGRTAGLGELIPGCAVKPDSGAWLYAHPMRNLRLATRSGYAQLALISGASI